MAIRQQTLTDISKSIRISGLSFQQRIFACKLSASVIGQRYNNTITFHVAVASSFAGKQIAFQILTYYINIIYHLPNEAVSCGLSSPAAKGVGNPNICYIVFLSAGYSSLGCM